MWSVSRGGLFPTFSPNSQLLVIRRHLGTPERPESRFLRMLDAAEDGRLLWQGLHCHKPVFGFHPGLLLTDLADPRISFAQSGTLKAGLATTRPPASAGLAFTGDGRWVAGFGWDPAPGVEFFAVSDGTLHSAVTFDVPGGHQFDPATRRFVLSHDTRLVAFADATMFAAFDTSTGQPLFSPLTALAPVEMMEFSPDNSAVAVVTKQVEVDISEPVTILDTASGQALFRQTFSRPDLVSFSPAGGAFVVTGLKGDPPEFSFFIDTFSAPDIAHHGGLLVSTHEFEDPVTAVGLADAAGSTALAVTTAGGHVLRGEYRRVRA